MDEEKVLSVLIIGAGMSGICMGVKLQERGINDFLIKKLYSSDDKYFLK
jgi:cation diffusion facilitator CzcD-associated flavoprotein CzcO